MLIGSDVTNLVTNFVLSEEAEALVNGAVQENLFTPNDFTNPVTYRVISQSGDEKNWLVTVYLLTDIEEDKETGFAIYPNPAKNKLNINYKFDGSIKLMDNEGKAIKYFVFQKGLHKIDISSSDEGVYFLELSTEQNLFSRKFIISR